jgi:hypothetical protein
MALSERLVLEVDQAFTALNQLNAQLNRIDDTTLTPTLDIQTSGLDNIDQTLREAEQAADNLAVAAGRASAELRVADTNVGDLASSLGVSEDRARQLASEFVTSQIRADNVADAAREVARQLNLAEDDAQAFVRQMGRATDETRDTARAASGVTSAFGSIRSFLVGGIAAFGITQAVQGLVSQLGRAVTASTNLSESTNAVNVVFEEGAETIRDFASAAAESAGLSTAAAQQLVVPIGSLLRNFGFDAQEAADATVILTQRAADMASVFNTDVTEALTAVQAALRGEGDPIERFGANVSAARVEAFALAEGLAASKDEITDQIKLQARLGLILADTERVAGDFSNTSDELANRQRTLNAQWEDAQAALGTAMLPAMEALVGLVPTAIALVGDLVPVVEDLAEAFADAAPDIAEAAQGIPDAIDATVRAGTATRDTFQLLGAGASAVSDGFEQLFSVLNIGGDGWSRYADNVDEGNQSIQRIKDELEDLKIGGAISDISASLQAGVSPVDAFGVVVTRLGDDLEIAADDLTNLAEAANLDDLEADQLQGLIDGFDTLRDRIGDTNVDTIISELERLRFAAIAAADPLVNQGDFSIGFAFGEIASNADAAALAVEEVLTPLQALQALAEESGRSVTELAIGSGELDPAFADAVSSGEGLIVVLREIQTDAAAAAAVIADTLGDAITSASDAFVDANEDNRVSAAEFLSALTEQAGATAEFEGNLLTLAQSFPALAETLRTAGAEVAGDAAAEFADNFDLAGEAEAVLQGDIPQAADAIAGFADDAVDLANTDPAALAFWEAFAASLETPGFASAVQSAVNSVLGGLTAGVPLAITPDGGVVGVPTGAPTAIAGGGMTVIINNPVTEDVTSSAAQAGQIVGSIGGLLPQ